MTKTIKLIIVVLIILGLALAVYYYFKQAREQEEIEEKLPAVPQAKKTQIDVGAAATKPLEKMPEINPYKDVANPFKEAYKNPFK